MIDLEHPGCHAPGVVILTGQLARAAGAEGAFERQLSSDWHIPGALRAAISHGGWLLAAVVGRGERSGCLHRDSDGVAVLFDGYLTDVAGHSDMMSGASNGAELVARLYRKFDGAFIPSLRGSFVGLIVDERTDSAVLFNDRSGSRPLFIRRLASGLAIAPRVRFLAKLDATGMQVRARAVGSFLLRGCCYGNDTLFDGVEKIDQATTLSLKRTAISTERYWRPRYGAVDQRKEAELIDEFDARLRTGVRRLRRVARRPVLLLSGGVDSRIMLACLMGERDEGLTAFSYAVAQTDGDDHIVAKSIAEECGIPHETFVIKPQDFVNVAAKEVLAADGRVQMIDAPSSRWEHIGASFDGMWIGDECFGWKGSAKSGEQALDLIGWWNLDRARRAADWFKRPVARKIATEIAALRKQLLREVEWSDPDDAKDALYFSQRMGNLLNGYHARRLSVCEQLRPLLDEDVIDFVSGLPNMLRIDKAIAHKLMSVKYKALNSLPYSKKTSVPWRPPQFAGLMSADPQLSRYIVDELTSRLDTRLQALVDEGRLRTMLTAFSSREPLPTLRGQWWTRLPGLWRYAGDAKDGVTPVQAVLRLLNINLYLSAC